MTLLPTETPPLVPERQDPDTQQITQEEIDRIEGYREIYKTTHPEPERVTLSFSKELGLESSVTVVSSIGGLILAAVRTAGIFYVAETLVLREFEIQATWIQGFLPVVAMLATLFGVEGYLFAHGLIKGRESQKISANLWGLLFAFTISGAAGIVSSLPILSVDSGLATAMSSFLYWILIVVSGIGGPVLAYLGSLNIGILRNKWDHLQAQQEAKYQEKVAEYMKHMQADYRNRGRSALYGLGKYTDGEGGKQEARESVHMQKVSANVVKWLEEKQLTAFDVGPEPGMLAAPADIAHDLGLTDSGPVRTALSRLRAKSTT